MASDPRSSSLFVFMIFTPPPPPPPPPSSASTYTHTYLCLCLSVCLSVSVRQALAERKLQSYKLQSLSVCLSGSVFVRPSDCLSLCLSHPLPVQLWIRITSSFCFLATRKTQSRIYPRNPSGGYMLTSISPKLNTATNQISKKTLSLFPWKASGIVR